MQKYHEDRSNFSYQNSILGADYFVLDIASNPVESILLRNAVLRFQVITGETAG